MTGARRIVITGASTGIGAAMARHYARPDTTLALFARRKDLLDSLAAGLPGAVVVYPGDIADIEAQSAAARDFVARFGAPDLVVANAGISIGTEAGALEDIGKLQRVLEVNVLGMAATLAAFAPSMKASGAGVLCGIASVAGFRGLPGAGAYSASKAAAISWLESLRTELHGSGVSVVTICPGYIDTPMTQVNTYRMPFLLPVDEAVRRFARAIEARRRIAVIPWQMAIVGRILRVLPAWLYDRLAARAPRKPRDVRI